jgi:hypothetical protein
MRYISADNFSKKLYQKLAKQSALALANALHLRRMFSALEGIVIPLHYNPFL